MSKDTLTEEEKKQVDADIDNAKKELVSKDVEDKIEQVKQETKEQVTKELETKQRMDELQKQNETLQKQLEDKEKGFAESFDKLKTKVDDMVTSKAEVKVEDPFKEPDTAAKEIDKMSDEELDKIEERSGREFLGDAYDDRLLN